MSSFDKTMQFNFSEDPMETDIKEVLFTVYDALREKGYNPTNCWLLTVWRPCLHPTS